jgi:hypothetical protein
VRNYGEPQFLDMIPDGPSVITPGTTPTLVEFLVQAPKAGVGESWPLGMNYVFAADITFNQPGAGASVVEWEDWFNFTYDSFDVNVPLLGNTHQRDTYQAILSKHVIEFVSTGYTYTDGARAQIPTAAGNHFLVVYQVIPMANENADRPQHSAFWLGWLNAAKVQAWMATAASPNSFSTGATITSATVRGWIEYVVSDELIMPVLMQWNRYTAPAGGQTNHFLTGIGTARGLNDVKDGSRICGMFEMSSGSNMGGATTPDQYTSMLIPQFSQDQTVNLDAYFAGYRRVMNGHHGVISKGPSATEVVVEDAKGNPQRNNTSFPDGSPPSRLNSADARYIPIRAPGRNMQLSKQLKFFGDLKRTVTFLSAAPSSGQYVWLLYEAREIGEAKKKEMVAKTGRHGSLERIWSGPNKDNHDSMGPKRAGKGREATLPQVVRFG